MGVDVHGNAYFRGMRRTMAGHMEEKRWVKLKGMQYYDYTPEAVPPEWFRWLNRGRQQPPTPEELQQYDQQRLALQQRVAVLDAEEAKRKLRMETGGGSSEAAGPSPNMGRFLEQLGSKGYGEQALSAADAGAGGSAASGAAADPGAPRPQAADDHAGRPGAARAGGEAQGHGDTFKPGAWQPGQS